MEIVSLNQAKPDKFLSQIKYVANALKNEKIIIYPTDTIYSIGGNGLNLKIIKKIFAIKKRTSEKALPLLIKNIEMAEKLAFIDKKTKKIIEAVWPGQITLILWKRRFIPLELTSGNETVAMRFNNHWFLDKLFEFIDFPLISTSANISGKENLYNINDLIKTFEKEKIKPDIIIDAGDINPDTPASTIIDLTKPKPMILRIGAVKPDELLKILEI